MVTLKSGESEHNSFIFSFVFFLWRNLFSRIQRSSFVVPIFTNVTVSKIFEKVLINSYVGKSVLFSNSQNRFRGFQLTADLFKVIMDWISIAFETSGLPWSLRHLVLLKLPIFLHYRFLTRSSISISFKNNTNSYEFSGQVFGYFLIFQ